MCFSGITLNLPPFFFIDRSSKLSIENDLAAGAAGISDNSSVDDGIRVLRSRSEEWLLVINNADDALLDLRPCVPWLHSNALTTAPNCVVYVSAQQCRT
ncbi:hypothetical protein DL96DRAFT_1716329 [Flagelloscypha sp. PMI_526]|nr:hypothetical protein DL96DRAFT_1716329 [Flagelloscypha sp. PMI_526]